MQVPDVDIQALAGRIPSGGSAIWLIAPADSQRARRVALALAEATASGRPSPVMLVNLTRDSGLDASCDDPELGLSDVLEGERELKDVAVRAADRGYIYVPAGQGGLEATAVLAHPAWQRIQRAARRRGAALLLYLPADQFPEDVSALPFDGAFLLELDPESGGLAGPAVLGVVPSREPGMEGQVREVTGARTPSTSPPPVVRRRSRSDRMPRKKKPTPPKSVDPERQRRRRSIVVALVILLAGLVGVSLAVVAVQRSGEESDFLAPNDSLWNAPVPAGTSLESADTAPDSLR